MKKLRKNGINGKVHKVVCSRVNVNVKHMFSDQAALSNGPQLERLLHCLKIPALRKLSMVHGLDLPLNAGSSD